MTCRGRELNMLFYVFGTGHVLTCLVTGYLNLNHSPTSQKLNTDSPFPKKYICQHRALQRFLQKQLISNSAKGLLMKKELSVSYKEAEIPTSSFLS